MIPNNSTGAAKEGVEPHVSQPGAKNDGDDHDDDDDGRFWCDDDGRFWCDDDGLFWFNVEGDVVAQFGM